MTTIDVRATVPRAQERSAAVTGTAPIGQPDLRPRFISVILVSVERSFALTALLVVVGSLALVAQQPTPPSPAPPSASPAPASPAPAPAPQQPAPQQPAPTPEHVLRSVVIDPAHGGADEGAHGTTGVIEKDMVLFLAQAVRAQLESQGLRVVLTRQGNEDPSFDQRTAIANAQPDAIFLSLHVSSTGPVGSARAYYYDFSKAAETGPAVKPGMARAGMLPWDRAQQPYVSLSQRLAELLQVELSQRFRGSPDTPAAVPVYQLRSLAMPAIAVELSSVAVPDAATLNAMAPQLAAAVTRAVASFRPLYEAGVK